MAMVATCIMSHEVPRPSETIDPPGLMKSSGKFAMRIRDWIRPTVDVPDGLPSVILSFPRSELF